MKVILQDSQNFILRFDKDEELIEGLKKFMQDQQVLACAFSGVGSALFVELGYFNAHLKDYRHKPFPEELEIISLLGNGAMVDGQPAIHLHGMFGRTDFSVFGGHVFKLNVSATCEIHVSKLEGQMQRKNNPDFNLNLLD